MPKTINMIDMVEGNKCYAQIVFITTADKLDDYKTLEYEQIIGFKDITEKLFLCLGIKDIKKSNDTKNICYYYCKKNDKDIKTKIDYFSLKECEYIFSSNSSLKHELIPYLQYFYGQIDKLSLEKFSKNEINIDLYRKYYEQFIKLSKTDSVYILPFTNKLDKYKRIVLTIKDNEEKITKYFFENTDVAEIRNDEEKEYRDILLKQGVILPKNAILGSIDFVDFNKEEINKFKNGILDEDSISCSIEENFEGEKVRIQRVITSIENILSSNVKNEKLVNLVCNKDVENIQKSTYYKTNSKYISDLKSLYPLIKNNEEQLIAIDKVVQMDKNEIDLMLIQGPPGTGKTELILTILKELYKRDHKVLVTSNVHVACENIFDRFKNNKDIPLKYYTSVKGDIYYDEILKNKHKYIQNQVLDGFEIYSKNEKILIDSRDKLEKINKTLAEYNSQSINMIKQKESKDKQLQKYNELLECEKRLVIDNLKIQLKKIAVSKEIVNLDSTLREYENQRIKLCRDKERLENGKKSFLSKLEVEKNKITELSDNLINLYNEKKDKECKIECNKNAISALEKNEGTLLEKNENIDRYKSFLNDLDYKIVLDAIKEWEKMGYFLIIILKKYLVK